LTEKIRKVRKIIKKASVNDDLIKRFRDDPFGIKRNRKGWQLRLGIIEGKTVFNKNIPDSRYGRFEGLRLLLDIRDRKREELSHRGLCQGTSKKLPMIDENGRLRRLYLSESGRVFAWKVYYTKSCGTKVGKTCSFYKNFKVRQAFIEAVMYLRRKEIEDIGSSLIDVSMKGIDRYLNAYIKTMDKSSRKFRELRLFL
jgi:hypothetical protein